MAMRGFIATVLSSVRKTRNGANVIDVQADPGGGGNVTVEHLGSPGDDSPPLPSDSVGAFSVEGTGRVVAGGYADPQDPGPYATNGERRLYSRSSAGVPVATVFLHDDGTITIENDNGSFAMAPDGTVTINGATIDPSGNIVSPADISSSGVASLNGHAHSPGTFKDHTSATITGTSGAPTG